MKKLFPTPAQKKAARQEQRKEKALAQKLKREVHSWDCPCSLAWPYRKRNSDKMRWDVCFEPTPKEEVQIGQGLIINARVDVTCTECKAKMVEHALRSDADVQPRDFNVAAMQYQTWLTWPKP